MNWKCILIGGVVFMVVTFAASMATGPLIHNGILDPHYTANASFWQPALVQDPPDMAAMMPTWLLNSLIVSLIIAWLYCRFGGCLDGPGWKRGANFGFSIALLGAGMYLGMSGVFYLPYQIWLWWAIDGLILYTIGGAAMGWATARWGD